MWWSITCTHLLNTSRNADCTFSKNKAVPKSQTELFLQSLFPSHVRQVSHAVSGTAQPVTFCPFSSPYLQIHRKCQSCLQQHSLYVLILQVVCGFLLEHFTTGCWIQDEAELSVEAGIDEEESDTTLIFYTLFSLQLFLCSLCTVWWHESWNRRNSLINNVLNC